MRADLAPRAVAPDPAVDPPSAVDPRAAKPPMTRATSTTRVRRAVLSDLVRTRRLTVTTAPSFRDFQGFRAGARAPRLLQPSFRSQGPHRSAPMPVARAGVIVREARVPPADQAF